MVRPKKHQKHRRIFSPDPVAPKQFAGVGLTKYTHQLEGLFQKLEFKVQQARASKFAGFCSNNVLREKYRKIHSIDRKRSTCVPNGKLHSVSTYEPFDVLNVQFSKD